MSRVCSHTASPHQHPHPCRMASYNCSEQWAHTVSTPLWLSSGPRNIHKTQREAIVVPDQIASHDQEEDLKKHQPKSEGPDPRVWIHLPSQPASRKHHGLRFIGVGEALLKVPVEEPPESRQVVRRLLLWGTDDRCWFVKLPSWSWDFTTAPIQILPHEPG